MSKRAKNSNKEHPRLNRKQAKKQEKKHKKNQFKLDNNKRSKLSYSNKRKDKKIKKEYHFDLPF